VTFAVLVGVLGSSLVGSVHCVAMCGPLLGFGGLGAHRHSLRLGIGHGLGRLVTYAVLGVIAGAIGGAIDLAGSLAAVQRTATIVAGSFILAWGLWSLSLALGWRRGEAAPARGHAFGSALVRIRTTRPSRRAFLYGTLTGLLPCGWLWAFVVTAGGTAHWWSGGLVMVAFWLGTMPAMLGLFAFGGPLLARIRAQLPAITACVLIALGVITLAMRWRDAGSGGVTAPHCHTHVMAKA